MNVKADFPGHQVEAAGGERLRFGEVEVVVKASSDTTG